MIKRLTLKKVKKILAKRYIVISLIGASTLSLTFLIYNLVFLGKIYPGVFIAGIPVSGLTTNEAYNMLSERINSPNKATLAYQDSTFEIDLETIGFSYDFSSPVEEAYKLHRSGNIMPDFYSRILSPAREINLPLKVNINEQLLLEHLSIISDEISVAAVQPLAKLAKGKVVVEKGSPGLYVDLATLSNDIIKNLSQANYDPLTIHLLTVDPTISDVQAQALKERAEGLMDKNLTLTTQGQVFKYEEEGLFRLLGPNGGYSDREIEILITDISSSVNRPPQDAAFVFESGKVIEFAAAIDGLEVEGEKLKQKITDSLKELEGGGQKLITTEIPLSVTSAEITLDAINNLGISELLGKGASKFRGSISSRIFNIGHSSAKFNGVLIPPGEIFSFNDVLGDVSAYTGYKKAYIIKDGRTVLGDGGGVCQVSTTLFRAMLDSGLPIVERRAHSYRVTYYEQDSLPGLDATVYAPYTDLKAKNDTPGHLLIQTRFDKNTASLVFEIYGTSDGRIANLTKPVITSTSAPPEDLYQDDPSLPAGTIKQVDFRAWGAKVNFDYEVIKDGEVIYEKTFYSNFRPWQAVYLRGTGALN